MSSIAQEQKAAFDRMASSMPDMEPELRKAMYNLFVAGWQAANSTYNRERLYLEKIAEHAEGLSLGLDWNNGTAANRHRDKLCTAVKALLELREAQR